MISCYGVPAAENISTFNDMFQFPDIARPRMIHEQLHYRVRKTGNALFHFFIKNREKMLAEKRNIVFPFPQRRQDDINNAKPEVQVFAKLIFADLFLEVSIGCSNDSHIYLDGLILPYRVKGSFLEKTQQSKLHTGGYITNLIKKEGAAVSLEDSTQPVTVCTGK